MEEKTDFKLDGELRIDQEDLVNKHLMDQIFSALSNTVEAKDRYTNGHSLRVARYARSIAKRMGMSEEKQQEVYYAGLLHDVGKIRVPITIINKCSPLDENEFEEMKLHTLVGYYILKKISSVANFAIGARWHHEHYDGSGYPNGLSGENIPLVCRIICVADAYDAMTSYRSYQKVLPQARVREEILNGAGSQFDPQIAKIMVDIIDDDVNYEMRQEAPPQWWNILAIDDDPMVLHLLKFLFQKEPNYRLITASSADEGLEILNSRNDIALVLLDVEMPQKDGFFVLDNIRKTKEGLPVIFMTGDKELEIIQKAEAMGISDYLTKPILPRMLIESIENVLSISRNWHG